MFLKMDPPNLVGTSNVRMLYTANYLRGNTCAVAWTQNSENFYGTAGLASLVPAKFYIMLSLMKNDCGKTFVVV